MYQYSRISDSDLQSRLNAIRAMIRRTRKNDGDTTDAEVELCYLEREQEIRQDQQKRHKEYLDQLKKEQENRRRDEEEEQEALNDLMAEA